MTGLRFAVFFCVLIIQRVASQSCNCQTELCISIDDLMKALNNGPGIPGLIETNQNQCGCQPPCQQPCQPSCQNSNQPNLPQQKTSFAIGQPTFSISGFNLGNQGQPQPAQISQPSQFNSQSLQINQPSQFSGQSLQINQPSQFSGQSLQINQPSQFSGQYLQINQPSQSQSLQINQPSQCGCQSLQISQPSQCGCQSIQLSQPSCGCQNQQLTISNPSISFQPISIGQSQAQKTQQTTQIITESVPSCLIPAALLQAPPYGIIFAGDNLLIDGAVQVCGNMPFKSIIELGGVMPSSGSGCVQYSCGDSCAICA